MAGPQRLRYRLREKDLPFLRSVEGRTLFSDFSELAGAHLPPWEKVLVVGDASGLRVPEDRIFSLFYDGRTRRKALAKGLLSRLKMLRIGRSGELSVANPPGTVTEELFRAAGEALRRPTKVFVRGEEDLATLALIARGKRVPIVYGIPGKGMCFMRSDPPMRRRARTLLGLG